MNTKIKSVLAAASMLALSALTANAQLILGGSFKGAFSSVNGSAIVPISPASTTFINVSGGVDVAAAGFSQVTFTGGSFAAQNIPSAPFFSSGVPVGVGGVDFTIFNGNDNGVSSTTFDLYLDFTSNQGNGLAKIATITWNWLPTDPFTNTQTFLSAVDTLSFIVGDYKVNTKLTGVFNFEIENGFTLQNRDTAGFNYAVPEPSTYALFGVVALMGVVAVRRFRSSKKVA